MAEKNTAVKAEPELELTITRVFDAPRSLVYQAWTHPAHLERWQGAPEGMTITSIQKDLRPGGMMKLCMRSADGQDHWLQAIYREVVENERLVFTHTWLDAQGKPGKETLVTITFANRADKTELKLHQIGFKSVQSRDGHMGGWNSMLDRLGGHIESEPLFVISRIFDAPPVLVYEAWTDPRHMAQWWGPHRFTNPVCELDVRPGGKWRIVMRGPDGIEHPCKGVYREIVPPERLIYTVNHSELSDQWHDMVNPHRDKCKAKPKLEAVNTVTFEDINGKTRLTIRRHFESVAVRNAMLKIGMNEGWSQSLERLEQLTASTADREIIITRVFDAPRELVWKVWTEPQHVVQWWGPKGFTTTITEMDVRPGGVWKQVMHGPDGTDYPNESVFTEVVKPERIVFNLGGGKKGAPGIHFQMTWMFDPEGSTGEKTRVTIRQIYATAADRDRVVKEFGAIEGGKQTLERLAEYLAKM